MEFLKNILEIFSSIMQNSPICDYISSILLGGSYIAKNTHYKSDLDLLIVCERERSTELYEYLMSSITEKTLMDTLDIKIIEKNQINLINNSIYSPFFYHFALHSIVLVGEDLRDRFNLKDEWKHQAIHKSLENLELVKKLVYEFFQPRKAEILLFEIAKRICIIYELKFNRNNMKHKQIDTVLNSIFGKRITKIKNAIRQQRSWLTVMLKENRLQISFVQEIKCKKGKIINYNDDYCSFIESTTELVLKMGNQCY